MGTRNGFDAELFFSALADKTRLRLLNLMRDGEVCVCFFAEVLGTNNPKISRHLAYLKRANLVTARRDGKWMHYSLNVPSDAAARDVFNATMKMLASDDGLSADRVKLIDVSCAPNTPVSISRRDPPRPAD
jgi:ArsR family transcriptional regulator